MSHRINRVAQAKTVAPTLVDGDAIALSVDTADAGLRVHVTNGGAGGTAATVGDPVPSLATPAGFEDASGDLALATLSALGNLNVNLAEGSISGGNGAASDTGAAVPAQADYTGVNVGGNLRGAVGFDLDSGGGTEYVQGVSLRKAASGGSAELGTLADPVRTDTTGTTTQPVSAVALPLPSGAATAAKQPALGTAGTASADVLTVQGVTSMTPLLVDGSGVTQPVSGTVTVTQGTAANLKVDASGVAVPVTDNSGSLTVDGTVTAVGGAAAGAAASGNPLRVAGLGRTTLPTVVTADRMVDLLLDRYGRAYVVSPVLANANSAATPITTNTTTSCVSAPSSGNHLRVHRLWAQNSSATGTWCYWCDGTTKKVPFYLAQYQPFSMDLKGGWELTTATALQIITSTTGANIEWFAEYETLAD